MNLQLLSTKVTELNLTTSEENIEEGMEFRVANAFTQEPNAKTFLVIFKFVLHLKEGMDLFLEYRTEFELDKEITEEFRDSRFPVINAPAIAYPYARAFISNFLLNAGYEPVLLPSVNFVKLYQDSEKTND